MSDLLGLSFDGPASPAISMSDDPWPLASGPDWRSGWGIAWYPVGELAAAVVKDPVSTGSDVMSAVLRDWDRFRSTIFVCHLRGAAKRAAHRDTHPFLRAYGGRTWSIAHNGDLRGDLGARLPIHGPEFEPIGQTDTERLFGWLLSCARDAGAATLSEFGYDRLADLFAEANELGTLNVVLSDGLDLIAYQDRSGHNPMSWRRRVPPHAAHVLERNGITLDLSGPLDENRTALVVSTEPLDDGEWTTMAPGQLLVIRRGAIHYDTGALTDPVPVLADAHEMPDPGLHTPGVTAAPVAAQRRPPERLLEVNHRTTYTYDEPVVRSSHRFRLVPVRDRDQRIQLHSLEMSVDGVRTDWEDVFGNDVAGYEIEDPFTEFSIVARSIVRVRELEDPSRRADRPTIPLVWMPWQRQMMLPYLLPPELPEIQLLELSELATGFAERNRNDLWATLEDMNVTIHRDFTYHPGATTLATTPWEVYTKRAGVCQDFANLLICLARLTGIPARYRTGYIYTGADYENTMQSEASHAWVEVYLPHLGWRGLDPTNGCVVGPDHVRVACGRNYIDATPTAGTIHRGGGAESLHVEVRVEPLDPGPPIEW
ncbi:MAG: class II glutamine amidotransferase [Acidimicrobiales bacterium]